MQTHITKVAIIGSGAVGSTVAFSLVVKGVAATVALVDINRQKAMGEAMDLRHSMDFQRRNVRVASGGYDECRDADIVVITAAAPYNGETDRLAMQDKTAAIMKKAVPEIMESGFDGIIVVVSNPVDIISYQVMKLSGLPKSRVIGTGTILETARLKQEIGQIMDMDPRSIDAYVMGEHGDSMMIPWSHVRARGQEISGHTAGSSGAVSRCGLGRRGNTYEERGRHGSESKRQYPIWNCWSGDRNCDRYFAG